MEVAVASLQAQEIAQQLRADARRALRMKLRAVDIAVLHDAPRRLAVVGGRERQLD